jgi:hypothetical protein
MEDEIKLARTAMKVVRDLEALCSIPDPNERLPKALAWIKRQESQGKAHAAGRAWTFCLPRLIPDFRTHGTCNQLWELKRSL